MNRKNQFRWTCIFTVLAIIAIVISIIFPVFLPYGAVLVVAAVSTLGTVWFYKNDRSAGFFVIAAGVAGWFFVWFSESEAPVLYSVIVACVYGALVAFQPAISHKLNPQIARVDGSFTARSEKANL